MITCPLIPHRAALVGTISPTSFPYKRQVMRQSRGRPSTELRSSNGTSLREACRPEIAPVRWNGGNGRFPHRAERLSVPEAKRGRVEGSPRGFAGYYRDGSCDRARSPTRRGRACKCRIDGRPGAIDIPVREHPTWHPARRSGGSYRGGTSPSRQTHLPANVCFRLLIGFDHDRLHALPFAGFIFRRA